MKKNVYAQLQNWEKKSVTLTVGGITVLIPISKKVFNELKEKLNLPEEG